MDAELLTQYGLIKTARILKPLMLCGGTTPKLDNLDKADRVITVNQFEKRAGELS